MIFGITAGVCVAAFVLVVLVRTLRFKPVLSPRAEAEAVFPNTEKAVADLCAMLACKTVSYVDMSKIDQEAYAAFGALLAERFPLVHSHCTLQKVGKTGLLYHLKGKTDGSPAVCMAHYDVVPVEEEGWTRPAFAGLVEDGCIWGRGALDTKSTLCAVLSALEQLLAEDYRPQNDLYLSFSGDEEVDGGSASAIVDLLAAQNVTPAFVLDEGGAVVADVFPGVPGACALVGIAEKGDSNLNLTLKGGGGHASTPPTHTLLGKMAKVIRRIEGKPFRCTITKPVYEMFTTLGRHSGFFYRMIFANLWCFAPVLDLVCRMQGGELNALMRTTAAVTKARASKAYNVLPAEVEVGVNMRLIGGETVESAVQRIRKIANEPALEVSVVHGMNPSICSATDGPAWQMLQATISATWEDALVSPYLMMACSDSRHYCRITDKVYRFSPMFLSTEERGMIHGNDERIPVETLTKAVAFYLRLLKQL